MNPNKKCKFIQRKENKEDEDTSSEDEEKEDAACLYCEYFITSDEGWVACIKCRKWAYFSCAGEEDEEASLIIFAKFANKIF